MKTFNMPMMEIQRIEAEEIVGGGSTCFETYACIECYCSAVACDGTYTCTGLVCPTLD